MDDNHLNFAGSPLTMELIAIGVCNQETNIVFKDIDDNRSSLTVCQLTIEFIKTHKLVNSLNVYPERSRVHKKSITFKRYSKTRDTYG